MAFENEKVLQTRIINKHAELATWEASSLVLKEGEIALAKVNVEQPDGTVAPTFVAKIGNGASFANSPWLFAKASDVYSWAKASVKPSYNAGEIARGTSTVSADLGAIEQDIVDLQVAIGEGGSVADAIKAAIEALDVDDAAVANQFVTAVAEADGKISVTRRALTADDIPELAIGKITGLQTALDAKAVETSVAERFTAVTTRLESGDIKQAIDAAKKAGDDAQAYAEGIYKADGETKTGVLAQYMTSNDDALAEVRGIADAAQTAKEVSDAIDTKIATFKTDVTDKLAERVDAAETDIGDLEEALAALAGDGRTTETVKGNADAIAKLAQDIGNVANVMNFRGVSTGETAGADITDPQNGDVIIFGEAEYVYNGSEWVKFGDASDNAAAISDLQERVDAVEVSLGEGGTTAKAIAAAQAQADKGVADAKTANDAIAVINGEGDGSIAKALADAKAYTDEREVEINKYADQAEADAIAAAKGYTDGLVKTINEAATSLKSTVDTHVASEANPHKVTAAQVGLDKVENKSVAEIKTELTGAVANDNTGFVTGDAVYDAIDAAKTAVNDYTDAEVKKVADDLTALNTDVTNNYARVKGNNLVYGQGENEMVIVFDCGGAQ